MYREKLTLSHLLEESLIIQERQIRFNDNFSPTSMYYYLFLHFLAALWDPITPTLFYSLCQGKTESKDDWQQSERGFWRLPFIPAATAPQTSILMNLATGSHGCPVMGMPPPIKKALFHLYWTDVSMIPPWLSARCIAKDISWIYIFSIYLNKLMFLS